MKNISRLGLFSISLLVTTFVAATELPTELVKQLTVADSLTFTGTVEAVNAGTASAQTTGRVVQTLVDVGERMSNAHVLKELT